MVSAQSKWDNRYRRLEIHEAEAASVLTEYTHLLPRRGLALDLASGLGANAIVMARHGLTAEAWDISQVALEKLRHYSQHERLDITTRWIDLNRGGLEAESFDVIVVSRFLDRNYTNAIIAALKQGGLLFYQTYTTEKSAAEGPNCPDYLLKPNELLKMFSMLRVVFYREYGQNGDRRSGACNQAQYIGVKF